MDVALKNIPDTITGAYERGFDEADLMWRAAISQYCRRTGMSVVKILPKVFSIMEEMKQSVDSRDKVVFIMSISRYDELTKKYGKGSKCMLTSGSTMCI